MDAQSPIDTPNQELRSQSSLSNAVYEAIKQPSIFDYALFFVFTVVASFSLIFSGWGFILIPFALFFTTIYCLIVAFIFKKLKASSFHATCLGVSNFILIVAHNFNSGIVTDSDQLSYVITEYLGVSGESLGEHFSLMSGNILLFFFVATLVTLIVVFFANNKKSGKIVSLIIVLISIGFFIEHLVYTARAYPRLKIEKEQLLLKQQTEERKQIEEQYAFDANNVYDRTFKDRLYSIFAAPEPGYTDYKNCAYTSTLNREIVSNGKVSSIDFVCYNDTVKAQIPIIAQTSVGYSVPTTNSFKKGDIFVFVAELEPSGIVWVNADGNNAKNGAFRMNPFIYEGVKETAKVGTTTYYEKSVVQAGVYGEYTPRKIMVLYPINTENLESIDFFVLPYLTQTGTSTIKLLEIAKITPPKYTDPEWLRDWSKLPNPFLSK